MSDREGWTCPVCKRGIAPGEKSCDHGGQLPLLQPSAPPGLDPSWVQPWHPYGIGGGSISGSAEDLACWNGAHA